MSHLLSSVRLAGGKGLELANRVVMAPLTRGRAGLSRVPNKFMKEYYELRASAGLIITEATAISEQGYGWYGAPGLYTEEHTDAWKEIVDAVHVKGGKIFLQLWHMGRQAHSSFHTIPEIVAPSAIAVPGTSTIPDVNQNRVSYETPRALETAEVKLVVEDFKKG
jgi:N-ethylmaleimide reductase